MLGSIIQSTRETAARASGALHRLAAQRIGPGDFMRIAIIATIACLLAPAALAQDPQQIQTAHNAALQDRDRMAAAANAAVAAKDWRLACAKSDDAVHQNDKAANLLQQLRDAVGSQIDPAMLELMSANIKGLLSDSNRMRQTRDSICAEANKPS